VVVPAVPLHVNAASVPKHLRSISNKAEFFESGAVAGHLEHWADLRNNSLSDFENELQTVSVKRKK